MQNIDLFARKQKNLIFHLFSLVVVNFHFYHPWDRNSSYWIKIGIKLCLHLCHKKWVQLFYWKQWYAGLKTKKNNFYLFSSVTVNIQSPSRGVKQFYWIQNYYNSVSINPTMQNSIELLFVCINSIYLH